jgi:hypothetical protein
MPVDILELQRRIAEAVASFVRDILAKGIGRN